MFLLSIYQFEIYTIFKHKIFWQLNYLEKHYEHYYIHIYEYIWYFFMINPKKSGF